MNLNDAAMINDKKPCLRLYHNLIKVYLFIQNF
jgi:hypothetical protein